MTFDQEWLVADGLGGYALGTAAGLRTRRYHGLLVVAGSTPAHRMLGLASLDPMIVAPEGGLVRLYTHEWASRALDPRGDELLESFTMVDGLPCWRWHVGEVVLERRVARAYGQATVAVTHTLLAGGPVELIVEPLCTWRDAHGERHRHDGLRVEPTADGFTVEGAYRVAGQYSGAPAAGPYSGAPAAGQYSVAPAAGQYSVAPAAGPVFTHDEAWYEGVFHRVEAERELSATEDLLRVGRFRARLSVGESLDILAWAGDLATPPPPARQVVATRAARQATLARTGPLGVAADAFVVRTSAGPDVVAGYPWFGAWSRDTMISYEGLFLATGRIEEGRSLLRAYAETLSDGMLANTADTGRTEYNTADATLWFLHAIDRHIARTGDLDLGAELAPALATVVSAHVAGTRFGIRIDDDGLLTQGADGYALTWMDAVVDGVPVTPRRGKAVELNALWINGLAGLGALSSLLGRDRTDLDRLHHRALTAFRARFPSPRGFLYDVIDGPGGDDDALRPNQLLAFGLPHAPLRGTSASVVRRVGEALLTPLGPRSLAPGESGYQGRHRGGVWARDHAYHQGTVWPWLIGPYVDAARAVGLPTDGVTDGLWARLADDGIGSVTETADGDPPHAATGCPFQAWSVAELLRIST